MRFSVESLSLNNRFLKAAIRLRGEGYLWSVNQRGTRILVHRKADGRVMYEARSIEKLEWFLKHVRHEREHAKGLMLGASYLMLGRGYIGELIEIGDITAKVRLPGGQEFEWPPSLLSLEKEVANA